MTMDSTAAKIGRSMKNREITGDALYRNCLSPMEAFWFPPPLWGRVGVGGLVVVLSPPTPTLPHKGGGRNKASPPKEREQEGSALICRVPAWPFPGSACRRTPPGGSRGPGRRL